MIRPILSHNLNFRTNNITTVTTIEKPDMSYSMITDGSILQDIFRKNCGDTIEYSYDKDGRLLKTTIVKQNENWQTNEYFYDENNKKALRVTNDSKGNYLEVHYDSKGREIYDYKSSGKSIQYVKCNPANNIREVLKKQPDGSRWLEKYNANGKRIKRYGKPSPSAGIFKRFIFGLKNFKSRIRPQI